MPKEQLGNRGSIRCSLQGEMRRDGHSALVCPACGWELPNAICMTLMCWGVPVGPGCPTLHGQCGNDPQRWDTTAPALLSPPTVRARHKSIPKSRHPGSQDGPAGDGAAFERQSGLKMRCVLMELYRTQLRGDTTHPVAAPGDQVQSGHRDVSGSGSTISATQLCWDLWVLSRSHSTL